MIIFKIMNAMFIFLGRLSPGEFIVIWTSTIIIVFFYFFLLFYLNRIEKDVHLLKLKLKKILDLL